MTPEQMREQDQAFIKAAFVAHPDLYTGPALPPEPEPIPIPEVKPRTPLIQEITKKLEKAISVQEIITETALAHGVTVDEILGHDRAEHIVIPRQRAMWLAFKSTDLGITALGKSFNRHHSTVLFAVRKMERLHGKGAE